MDYTQMLGNVNELKCLSAFLLLGYECSIPYGNGAKYDFIVDDGSNLYKILCKSSHYVNDRGELKENAFTFSTTCQTTNTKETIRHKYSKEDIDYFATSFLDKVYIVPVEECSNSKTLRLLPPENGLKNYSDAKDYLITNVFPKTLKLIDSEQNYKESKKSKSRKIYLCPICGQEVTKEGNLCVKCSRENSRKVARPEREELKTLIRTKSFVEIGLLYGVSDNSIKKWCKSYNLPSKKYEINKISEDNWNLI